MKRTLMAVTGVMLVAGFMLAAACGDDGNGSNSGSNGETPGAATAATGGPSSTRQPITGAAQATNAAIASMEPGERSTVVYATAIARGTEEAVAEATDEAREEAQDAAEETADAARDATAEAASEGGESPTD